MNIQCTGEIIEDDGPAPDKLGAQQAHEEAPAATFERQRREEQDKSGALALFTLPRQESASRAQADSASAGDFLALVDRQTARDSGKTQNFRLPIAYAFVYA